MNTYKIKISYQTGNSFGNEDAESYLELTWNDLDVAKQNLQRINEHYKMYQDIENLRYNYKAKSTAREDIYKQNINKDWFVYKPKLFCISADTCIDESYKHKLAENDYEYRHDSFYAENCINLYTDKGKVMQLSAFWTGYFERLYGAEIEVDNSDMKIEF